MAAQPITDQAFGIVPIFRQSDTDQFLLIQHQAGHWGFPKGHAEARETEIETACREFEEETGIAAYQLIDSPAFVESYRLFKKSKTIDKTVIYFIAFVQSLTVNYQEKEIRDYVWLTYPAALERLTFVQSKQLLIQVRQYLQRDLQRD
jgi:bis(5'-nucleosidyl)-tetraphosphatase